MTGTRKLLSVILWATACLTPIALPADTPKAVPYQWKNVQIVGGGFVDGIIFHPKAKNIRYARTDMGGAYRWDVDAGQWQPILDWVSYRDLNLMGVESIAVDPSDPQTVYLACGTYTNPQTPNGAILRSHDGGRHFGRTDVPFKFGGNENGRGNGERLVVDPNDGHRLFLGTRHDGLWKSVDRGENWLPVPDFPVIHDAPREVGIVFVLVDPRSGSPGQASSTLYAGQSIVGQPNLLRSVDGGKTWQPLPGEPTQYRPTRAALAADGMLYVAYGSTAGPSDMTDGAVWRFDTTNGDWTDITPDHPTADRRFGYAAVAVDAQNPATVIASSFHRPRSPGDVGEDIFRSLDRGQTWTPVFASGGQYDPSQAPYVAPTPIHWLFDIEIDPFDSDHVMFTTGYGGWESFDFHALDSGAPTHWQIMSRGIEETVALQLVSPTRGVPLISAIGDYGGFAHADLDHSPPEGASAPPRFGNTTGVAVASQDPDIVVRVGDAADHGGNDNISYSLDGGHVWQPTAETPQDGARAGKITVTADGGHWIWQPSAGGAYETEDQGHHWTALTDLPAGISLTADPVDPGRLYGLSLFTGQLVVSEDGGAHFKTRTFTLPGGLPHPGLRGDPRGGQDRLYATPGRRGDLWLAAADGLYHLTSLGRPFQKIAPIEEIHAFGFGQAAPGQTMPALYLVGTVDHQAGIFRSDDAGQHWLRINDDQHQWGLILQIAGDPKRFGRVYVGTHGRGIFYGDPRLTGKQP